MALTVNAAEKEAMNVLNGDISISSTLLDNLKNVTFSETEVQLHLNNGSVVKHNYEEFDNVILGNYLVSTTISNLNSANTDFNVYYEMGKEDLGLYFDNYLDVKDKYAYFLDANHALVQIRNNDIDSDEKLLIIKDSYANCLVPFLAESYKEVDVIDLRFFNLPMSTYLKTAQYDRIIVLYNKNGFATNADAYKLGY
jgi:hypothetical protein